MFSYRILKEWLRSSFLFWTTQRLVHFCTGVSLHLYYQHEVIILLYTSSPTNSDFGPENWNSKEMAQNTIQRLKSISFSFVQCNHAAKWRFFYLWKSMPLMYIVHSTIRWNDFGILTMLKSRWVIYDPPQANQVHQERNGPLVCPTVVIPCSPSQLQSSEKSNFP